ncbi:MAG: glycosyltransferase [Firmicutes bacterium]|nr:glycosyltransferase [Bacillota bacterium]
MKITMLIYSMQKSGGTERVTANLANRWAEKDNEVMILTVVNNIESFYPLAESVSIRSLAIGDAIRTPGGIIKWLFFITVAVVKYLLKEKPDILLGVWTSMAICAILAGKIFPCKTIACEHIGYAYTKISLHILRRLIYPLADAVVTLTETDRNKFEKINCYAVCIPNFTNLPNAKTYCNYSAKVILAVGRMAHQKGFDLLLTAWEKIQAQAIGWKLLIIGGPSETDDNSAEIREMRLDKNLQDTVTLLPVTNNILDMYLKASVFVLSSRYEGLPMVLIEAMSQGLAVISFDCPTGPKDIIKDGQSGLLVPPENIDLLAAGLIRLIENEALRKSMGMRAKADIWQCFNQSVIDNKWVDLFERLTK